jgi:hypothetical protein
MARQVRNISFVAGRCFEPRNSPFPRSKRNSRRRHWIPAFRTKFPSPPHDSRLPSEIPVHSPQFPRSKRNSRRPHAIPVHSPQFPRSKRNSRRPHAIPVHSPQFPRYYPPHTTPTNKHGGQEDEDVKNNERRSKINKNVSSFSSPTQLHSGVHRLPSLHCHERPESQQPNYRGVASTKKTERRQQGRLVRAERERSRRASSSLQRQQQHRHTPRAAMNLRLTRLLSIRSSSLLFTAADGGGDAGARLRQGRRNLRGENAACAACCVRFLSVVSPPCNGPVPSVHLAEAAEGAGGPGRHRYEE